MAADPLLIIASSTKEVDFFDPDSGFSVAEPYWNPQIADLRGGGTFVDPVLVEGRFLVFGKEGNVIESIPFTLTGRDPQEAIANFNDLLDQLAQAENYQKEPGEYDPVWIAVRLAQAGSLTGYARIVRGRVPELPNPFGQPFFTEISNLAKATGLTLALEREPFWRAVAPGEVVGPLYNLLKNPDFELWTLGNTGSGQPDSWTDIDTLWIDGTNSRDDTLPHSGNYALKIRAETSSLSGASKGVTQVVEGTEANTTYTIIAWVRNEGISNGVGRILITYSSQLELYRSADRHGWTLYAGTFTTGPNDTVAVHCEILSTGASVAGNLYIDSMMLLPGNLKTEAEQGVLPYLSSSHITNDGHSNYVDVWDVPGNADALVRLEVQNDNAPADITSPVEVFARIRISQRRTKDVLNLDNLHDPAGIADSNVANSDRVSSPALAQVYQDVTSKIIQNNVIDNLGRYRVLARVYDTRSSGSPNLKLRLRYFIGVAGIAEKTLFDSPASVRAGWTMVDLTRSAAMVQDAKKSTDTPAQVGYTVEMARSAGAEVAYLDYSIAMPTDGGWLDAIIDPPLTQGNMLIVDGTMAIDIAATMHRGGFQIVYQTTQVPKSLAVYRESLYIGCNSGQLYRYANGSGTLVNDYGANTIQALTVYNDRLYVAHGADIYTGQNLTFPTSIAFSLPAAVEAMATFNELIYFGLADGTIYSYNGSTTALAFDTTQSAVKSLAVYNNRLYAGTETASRVYQFDLTSNAWSLSGSLGGTGVYSLKAFKGKLYAGTGAAGQLYAFDGSWTLVETFTDLTTIQALESLNGLLYAAGSPASSVMVSSDGSTWTEVYDPAEYVINAMAVYNGALFLAENGSSYLLAISFADVQYKIPNYEGSPFTSPAKKRHRYFFVIDRENGLNNVSDTALIGIGFVPRYKTLRGNK